MAAGSGRDVRAALAVFARLCRLMPAEYEARHGPAARALFRRMAEDARGRGRVALLFVLLRSSLDAVVTAVQEAWAGRVSVSGAAWSGVARLDLRQALRSLMRRPGLTATVVLTLGTAIGATATVGTIVNGVLLRPLPYERPEDLYSIITTYSGRDRGAYVSYPDFLDFRSGARQVEGMAAYVGWTAVLTGGDEAARVPGMQVSDGFFDLLGVEMALGRPFLREEETDGKDRVIILGWGLWQRRWGGDPGVVGESVEIDGVAHTIVGVLPARFDGGLPALGDAEMWRPFGFDGVPADGLPGRGNESYRALVRIPEGTGAEPAERALQTIAAGIEQRFPELNEGQSVELQGLHDRAVADARPALLILLGAVVFLLLIAVANVTGVLLARATERAHEAALRAALGADRWRLRTPAVAEALLLALGGGLLGLLLAYLCTQWAVEHAATAVPLASQIRLDARIIASTLLLVGGAGLVTGLATATPGSSNDLLGWLRDAARSTPGRRRHALRRTLIVGQVAVSLLLASGAALLVRTLWALDAVDSGFDRTTLTLRVHLPSAFYPERTDVDAFYDRLVDRLAAIPGVSAAATVTSTPLSGETSCGTLAAVDDPDRFRGEDMCAELRGITPDYFEAMGIPLIAGRLFTQGDGSDAPDVVIISESTARLLWPDRDPLGRVLRTGFSDRTHRVVGVVADVKQYRLDSAPPPQTYIPAEQWSQRSRTVVVRASGALAAVHAEARAVVRALDARVPVTAVRSMDDYVDLSLMRPRFRAGLLAAFAAVALVLAAVGVYGTLSYLVNARKREMAIRRSVGARTSSVLTLILRDGLTLAVPGVLLGAIGALALNRLLANLLFGVSPTDPATLAAVMAAVLAVALLACLVPALRATRVDAATVLREE